MSTEGQMKFSWKDYSKFYVLSEAEYPSLLMSSVKKVSQIITESVIMLMFSVRKIYITENISQQF